MHKLVLIALLTIFCGTLTYAQQETPRVEVFAGFSQNRLDVSDLNDAFREITDETGVRFDTGLSDRTTLNGFNASVTGNINRVFGIKGDVSGHYDTRSFTIPRATLEEIAPGEFDSDLDVRVRSQFYNFLAGPHVKARGRRVEPFAHALFGVAHTRNSLNFSNTQVSVGDLVDTSNIESETSFAMAFGGGLDIRVSERFAIRAIQADYNPTFFSNTRQDNIRLSFGIVFR